MDFLRLLEGLRTPLLDSFFAAVTQLGGEVVFMAMGITVLWCVSKRCGYYLLTAGFFGTAASQFLKILCRVPRPWVLDTDFTIVESARAAATGYSFPSGHTTCVLAAFGCCGRWTEKKPLRWLCIIICALVIFSRMYLGVHTPLDVGVAALTGLALIFILYPIFRDMDARPGRIYAVIGLMLALAVLYTLFVELHSFPADLDAENWAEARKNGWTMIGCVGAMLPVYHLDRLYIRFETGAVWWAQIIKTALGLGILMGIRALLKAPLLALFDGHPAAGAVRYFIMVVFAGALWPLTFKFFGRLGKKETENT